MIIYRIGRGLRKKWGMEALERDVMNDSMTEYILSRFFLEENEQDSLYSESKIHDISR